MTTLRSIFYSAVAFTVCLELATAPSVPVLSDSVKSTDSAIKPTVNSLRIDSSIQHRYAKTRVISRLANPANVSQEVVFDMVLPKKAFITSFLMEIKGKVYKSYIKEKEQAAKVYQAAVQAGQTAAHVEVTARDSNHFGISVNIEANGKVKFLLNYEELLTRQFGKYNHVINLNPGQVVNDLEVNVYIQEAVNITDVYVPELRVTNEISEQKENENTIAKITRPDSKRAHISYRPSAAEQTKYAPSFGGQLVVQYDVDHSAGSQILVNDGYFVHFFAPQNLKPLRKLAVFVLDVSGSMYGRKMEQLKDAMNTILDNLGKDDYFNIIAFSHGVTVHNLENEANSPVVQPQYDFDYYGESSTASPISARLLDHTPAYPNTKEMINRTKTVINNLEAAGGTNIHDALKTALIVAQNGVRQIRLSERNKKEIEPIEPLIIFLTDGDPTVGVTNHQKIFTTTREFNYMKTPIFSLGFGSSADMKFLRRISLGNHAFARSIYEAADAAVQLKTFYNQVASPLLVNVTFDYINGQVVEGSLTKETFPALFLGSELVVAGKLDGQTISAQVNATSSKGNDTFTAEQMQSHLLEPFHDDLDETDGSDQDDDDVKDDDQTKKSKPTKRNTLERLWAYMTVQNQIDLIDVLEAASNKERAEAVKENVTRMALKFKFVTPFTSLVVVKPNSTTVTSAKDADSEQETSHAFLSGNHGIGPLLQSSAPFAFGHVPQRTHFTKYSTIHSMLQLGSPLSAHPPAAVPLSHPSPQSMPEDLQIGSAMKESLAFEVESTTTYASTTLNLDQTTVTPTEVQKTPSWFTGALSQDNSTINVPFGPNNVTLAYLWRKPESLDDSEVYENCTLYDLAGNSSLTHAKCKHIFHCSSFTKLNSLDEYKQNFCTIPGEKPFAGICCPDSEASVTEEETTVTAPPDASTNTTDTV